MSSTFFAGAAGLRGVLEQVDQHLLDLHRVEPSSLAGALGEPHRGIERAKVLEERGPLHPTGLRLGQTREPGVTTDERVQVLGALFDGVEHASELFVMFGLVGDHARGVNQGRDGSQGVIHLVAHDADDLFEDVDFSSGHFQRQVLDHEEGGDLPCDLQIPAGQVVGFVLAFDIDVEQTIRLAEERFPKGWWRLANDPEEVQPLRIRAIEEEIPRSGVRVQDHSFIGEQHQRIGVELREQMGGVEDLSGIRMQTRRMGLLERASAAREEDRQAPRDRRQSDAHDRALPDREQGGSAHYRDDDGDRCHPDAHSAGEDRLATMSPSSSAISRSMTARFSLFPKRRRSQPERSSRSE